MPAVSVKPSRMLAAWLCLAHFGAFTLVFFLDFSIGLKSGASLLLLASLIHGLRRSALLIDEGALTRLEIDESGCRVMNRAGFWSECKLLASSFVSPRLTVLHLKMASGFRNRSMTIVPDAVDSEEFRKLRIWLRWK